MIAATIFHKNGTIASTSEGRVIHILDKLKDDHRASKSGLQMAPPK